MNGNRGESLVDQGERYGLFAAHSRQELEPTVLAREPPPSSEQAPMLRH